MMKRLCTLILAVCLLMVPCHVCAQADTQNAKEPISLTQIGSLTLTYASEDAALPAMNIAAYHVAEVSADFQYTLSADFAATQLTLNGLRSQSEWDTVRTTLEMHVAAQAPTPVAVVATDAQGVVAFAELTPGLYFIPAQVASVDGFLHYFQSALVALPGLEEDGTWNYNQSANPKPSVRPPSSDDLEYRVLKLWQGDDPLRRPASITVDLIKDGTVVKTVTLSDENDWCYTWYAADDGSVWAVVETTLLQEYHTTINKNETVFSIINTYNTPPGTDSPETGDTSRIGLYVLLLCLSGIGLVLLGVRKEGNK